MNTAPGECEGLCSVGLRGNGLIMMGEDAC